MICTECQRSIPEGGVPRVCKFHFIPWVRRIGNEREWSAYRNLLRTRGLLESDDHPKYIGILEGLPNEDLEDHLNLVRGVTAIGAVRQV